MPNGFENNCCLLLLKSFAGFTNSNRLTFDEHSAEAGREAFGGILKKHPESDGHRRRIIRPVSLFVSHDRYNFFWVQILKETK